MAGLNGTITFNSGEYRPCYVDGKRALFHRWPERAEPIPGGLTVGSAPAGQLQFPVGIVEFENGEVQTVRPWEIRFDCNQMFGEMVWFGDKAPKPKCPCGQRENMEEEDCAKTECAFCCPVQQMKCEPCQPTQPECGECQFAKGGDADAD